MAGEKNQRISQDPPSTSQPIKPVIKPKPITAIRVRKTMNEVFSNDLLLKKVLEHVIYPTPSTSTTGDPKINYGDIKNVRLVQKSWLLSTSCILRKNRHPLYHLHNDRRVQENPEEKDEIINSFIQTMTQPQKLEPRLAPFKLTLLCGFFTPRNRETLVDLFEKCGSGLVLLLIRIPKCCSMPFVFPPISFGILQQLTVEFGGQYHNNPNDQLNPSFLENSAVTYFIQQLINSTRELKLILFGNVPRLNTDSSIIPLGFQFLSLPPTVEVLILSGRFSSNHLQILTPRSGRNGHLITLKIRASCAYPFLEENTIYKAVERHRDTIKVLCLYGGHYLQPEHELREPSLLKIPPMKNLQHLTFTSPRWLSVNNFYITSANYPKLTEFNMKGISLALFERLTAETRGHRLNSVKNVEIWLVNQLLGSTITLDKEKIERVHWTFHNLTTLKITICGVETTGLKYIFREMGNLKSLTINVRKNNDGDGSINNDGDGSMMTCGTWDGLFMGAPEWIAKGLRETPSYWEKFHAKVGYEDNPSIMKLTALSKLTLATKRMDVSYEADGDIQDRLLSEVAFHFALVKMPALKDLQLFGRFQPNELMIKLWMDKRASSNGLDETLLYDMKR